MLESPSMFLNLQVCKEEHAKISPQQCQRLISCHLAAFVAAK